MNRHSMLPCAIALLAGALASCQSWGPTWSEVTGVRYTIVMNRTATSINLIDGTNPGPAPPPGVPYYKLTPGTHIVEIQALNPTPGWVGDMSLRRVELNFEPCKRYYLNAQFANPLLSQWTAVVDYVETIAGCRLPTTTK
jgi:hypothetical protein